VFQEAIFAGKLTGPDPTPALRRALPSPKTKNHAHIHDPERVGKLMLDIDRYEGSPEVCAALKLAPLLFVRPGELRAAEWSEIQWTRARMVIPAEKMKMRQEHMVPLCTQALVIMQELYPITGHGRFLFSLYGKPMSENTILKALKVMGYKGKMTGNGFRKMARTMLAQEKEVRVPPAWIERQLAHRIANPVEASYDHATYEGDRPAMMQAWADYLDDLKAESLAAEKNDEIDNKPVFIRKY
jgi:integrase